MSAVIKTGGKQYRVSEGSVIYVEKLDGEPGDVVTFHEVLEHDGKIGTPILPNVTVTGEIVKNGKAKKIVVYKYKQKDRSNRKKQGHRQPYTQVMIQSING